MTPVCSDDGVQIQEADCFGIPTGLEPSSNDDGRFGMEMRAWNIEGVTVHEFSGFLSDCSIGRLQAASTSG